MRVSRRTLLAAGSAAALFPWTKARAQSAVPKKKLLLFFTPHGTVWPSWRPTGTETSFTLPQILAPLNSWVPKLTIVDGLSLPHGAAYYIPHTYTMPALWSGSPIDTASQTFCRTDHMKCFGWGTGITVDQAILARLPAGESIRGSIELGTFCGNLHPASRMIYSGPGTVKNPLDTPQGAFAALFSSQSTNAVTITAQLKRRTSVLDTVLADMNSRKGKLSAADQLRLDAHATAVRELERRLKATAPICTPPSAPGTTDSQTAMDRQSDLAAAALGCGLTRIVSMQMRIADNDSSVYPWLGLNVGGHHSLSHDSGATAQAKLAEVYTWYSHRFAYLLQKLATTPDPAGGWVLDNTVVLWGSELGRGYDHDISNVPFVLAGGINSGLRGGRYKKVTGMTHHRALVTAFHAMGFSDVLKFGSLDQGSGPLPGVLV